MGGLGGSENLPISFLLGIEDRLSRPTANIQKGQARFFAAVQRGGKLFIGTYDRMSKGFRKFRDEWAEAHGPLAKGLLLLRGTGRLLKGTLGEGLRLVAGLAGMAVKALVGIGIAAIGIGVALVMAAVKYKKFYLTLHEAMFMTGREMAQAISITEKYTAVLGHSREEVREVVKQGLELGYMVREGAKGLDQFTRRTLYLSKATGLGAGQTGKLVYQVGQLYRLGWHGVRQFGMAMKYTADMTGISTDELSGFVEQMGDVLATLPGRSRDEIIGMGKDMIMLKGALKDFDVNADAIMTGFGQTMRLSSEEGHRMLQMLAGFLGEDSRSLRRRFSDSPREFVFALSDALKSLSGKGAMVRDILEQEFQNTFGISLRDIRGLQTVTREGLLGTLERIEAATAKSRLEEEVRSKMLEKLSNSWDKFIATLEPIMAELGTPLLKKLTEVAPDFLRAAAQWAQNDFPKLFERMIDTIARMINAVDWAGLGLVISRMGDLLTKIMVKLGILKEEELSPEKKLTKNASHFLQSLSQSRAYKFDAAAHPMAVSLATSGTLAEMFSSHFKDQYDEEYHMSNKLGRTAALAAMLGSFSDTDLGAIEKAIRQMDPGDRDKIMEGVEDSLKGFNVTRASRIYREQVEPHRDETSVLQMMNAGNKRLGGLLAALSGDPASMFKTLSPVGGPVGGLFKRRQELAAEFDKAAQAAGIPKQLIESVSRRESSFSPGVESNKGARGLMQLMPKTAADMQKRLGLKADPLEDQTANIRAGAELLSILLKKYDGDVVTALSAYNWGTGNMDRALARADSPDSAMASIPLETRRYVQDILSDMIIAANAAVDQDAQENPEQISKLDDMIKVLEQIRDRAPREYGPWQAAPGQGAMRGDQAEVLRRAGGR